MPAVAPIQETDWNSARIRPDGTREIWLRSDRANVTLTLIQPTFGEMYVERIERNGKQVEIKSP